MVAYNHYMHDENELHNYLLYKTVNFSDLVRALWYKYMTFLKLTNAYRYDHLIKRPLFLYEYERLKQALNMSHRVSTNSAEKQLKMGMYIAEVLGLD